MCHHLNNLKFFQGGRRMLISADTELSWLYKFKYLSCSYHQLIGVPVFQDGGNCGLWAGNFPVLESKELDFVGDVQDNFDTNENIVCPTK